MNGFFALSCISAVLSIAFARNVNSKSISRSDESGSINLVEFSIKGVNYGQCSYTNDKGEDVSLIFEDNGKEMKARSSIPNHPDPVEEFRTCRSAAISPPESRANLNSGVADTETDLDLLGRISNFQRKLAMNQQYVSQLTPRFINIVPLATPVATGNPIKDKFANLFGGLSLGSVNVPFPVLNVPVGVKNIPFPIIVPTIQTVNIQKPVIGRR